MARENISHELRNPLAPIQVSAQLMQSPDVKPAQAVRTIAGRPGLLAVCAKESRQPEFGSCGLLRSYLHRRRVQTIFARLVRQARWALVAALVAALGK